MASFTLDASPQFPVGTTVSVHPGRAPASGDAPTPAQVDDGVVGSDGRVTFTGLEDATSYVAYAVVGGLPRYREFTTSVFSKVPYYDENGDLQRADLSTFGRGLLDEADAAAARATLGLQEPSETAPWELVGTYEDAFDPPEMLAGGVIQMSSVVVTGAAKGDFVVVSFAHAAADESDATEVAWIGHVTAANTVRIKALASGAADFAAGTLRVIVMRGTF